MLRGFVFITCFIFSSCVTSILAPHSNAQIETLRLGTSDLVLEAHKTHMHPFLAEYDFKLVLKGGSEELDSVEMTADSGGLSRIDVLRIDSSTIAFRDHAKTECLNIPLEKFDGCSSTISGKRIGYVDFDSKKKWRFIRRDGGRN